MPLPNVIGLSAMGLDLSPRVVTSTAIVTSPSAAVETTICTVTLPTNIAINTVLLFGWAAFTVGTSGTAVNLKLRRTDTSGSTLAATGATTGGIAATNLVDVNVQGLDTAPPSAQVYVLTLTVTAGAATSTVSACSIIALAV